MEKERCLLGCLEENKRVVHKDKCHPELDSGSHLVAVLKSGEIPNQVWNDSINNNAFTLIELLVVVLIIGILAAVALPQYQKAVWKARASELLVLGKTIKNAQLVYRMANGKFTSDINELSIDVPCTQSPYNATTNKLECPHSLNFLYPTLVSLQAVPAKFWLNIAYESQSECAAPTAIGEQICQSFGGVYRETTDGGTIKRYNINL